MVFASKTSLAVAFATPLMYCTCLKNTGQSSHSLVLHPLSSKFCVDPALDCNASSSASVSTLSLSSHSYSPTSLHPWSVLHILRWSIIGLRCFFPHIRIPILIIAILALIPVEIPGSGVKLVQFGRRPSELAASWDGIALVTFVTFIFVIPSAPWRSEMQFIICASVVYHDGWVSASDLRVLKHHCGGQIVEKIGIVNTCCFHTDDHGRRWVLCLMDLTLHCSKSVFIHPLLLALR